MPRPNSIFVEIRINIECCASDSEDEKTRQSQNMDVDSRVDRLRWVRPHVMHRGIMVRYNTTDSVDVTPSVGSQPIPSVLQQAPFDPGGYQRPVYMQMAMP